MKPEIANLGAWCESPTRLILLGRQMPECSANHAKAIARNRTELAAIPKRFIASNDSTAQAPRLNRTGLSGVRNRRIASNACRAQTVSKLVARFWIASRLGGWMPTGWIGPGAYYRLWRSGFQTLEFHEWCRGPELNRRPPRYERGHLPADCTPV
jgi:hypothetical protein